MLKSLVILGETKVVRVKVYSHRARLECSERGCEVAYATADGDLCDWQRFEELVTQFEALSGMPGILDAIKDALGMEPSSQDEIVYLN